MLPVNDVVFVSVNGLLALALAPVGWMAALLWPARLRRWRFGATRPALADRASRRRRQWCLGSTETHVGRLDSVIGAVSPSGGAGANEAVMQAISGLLAGQGGNGLEALVQRITQGGLGEVVQSWIGTGANQPVTADQLQSALGSDTLGALAQQAGMSHGDLAGHLAQLLPQVVDKLTPNGQLPRGGGDLGGLLGGILGGLFRR